jgi:hydroxymethylbilane synthase
MPLRIGTRSSALALHQARWVADRLGGDSEIVAVTTAGDRGEAVADKSRWVSALEAALLAGEVDVAVHSAKDVPGELADGLELIAVPTRVDPADALVGCAGLAELPSGARVGTSSLRRAAQLRSARPDLSVCELRGNVPTRLAKLEGGEVDALILAAAGLLRLGLEERIGGRLSGFVPAPGQGSLAVEARAGDTATRMRFLPALHDVGAGMELAAERALARALGASCHTPMGALARGVGARGHAAPVRVGAGAAGGGEADARAGVDHVRLGHVHLTGWVGLPDGSEWITDSAVGTPEEAARTVAEAMLAVGAGDLLARAAGIAEGAA